MNSCPPLPLSQIAHQNTTFMQYDFLTPGKVISGWGRRQELPDLVRGLGQRAFFICRGSEAEQGGPLAELPVNLQSVGLSVQVLRRKSGEPTVSDVDQLVAELRQHNAKVGDLLIAVGGGSIIDIAKAAGAMVTNAALGVSVSEFLEGPEQIRKLTQPALPLVAVPTTAGTGAEATKNASITSTRPKFKRSLRSDSMIPRAVLIDPELSVSVPPHITAWTGMDAITQCIESYVTKRAQPIPQALARLGLHAVVSALPAAVRDGQNRAARETLSQTAFLSGMALANSGLGLAHGVAAGLGARHDIPHGLACAVMLPTAMRFNVSTRPADFAILGRAITGENRQSDAADAEAGIVAIEQLSAELGIPRKLSELGIHAEDLPDLARASRGNSLNGNPREISESELIDLLGSLL